MKMKSEEQDLSVVIGDAERPLKSMTHALVSLIGSSANLCGRPICSSQQC